jgi:hypothetical protein
VYALAAIFGIMLFFNPPEVALYITMCVALIDVDLLGVIYALDLKLNAVSYVNLVRPRLHRAPPPRAPRAACALADQIAWHCSGRR